MKQGPKIESNVVQFFQKPRFEQRKDSKGTWYDVDVEYTDEKGRNQKVTIMYNRPIIGGSKKAPEYGPVTHAGHKMPYSGTDEEYPGLVELGKGIIAHHELEKAERSAQ